MNLPPVHRYRLAVLALTASACAGPTSLTGVDGVRIPEPPPPVFEVHVIAGDDLTPVAATLGIGESELAATDALGVATAPWRSDWTSGAPGIRVAAPGFHAATLELVELPEAVVEVRLDPVVLEGKVIGERGVGLPGATVALGPRQVVTDEQGEFVLTRVEPGDVTVSRPAWRPGSLRWTGSSETIEIDLEPLMIRALRVGGEKAGDPAIWNELLTFADNSGINAFVVDTKEESGYILRDVDFPKAHEIDAVRPFYDVDEVLADMDEHGLYKITRIVTFQDGPLTDAEPEISARNTTTGGVWKNNRGTGWLDPTDRDSWEYPLGLAVESCRRGFDEIQFDYVRFPSDGPVSQLEFDQLTAQDYYGEEAQRIRVETIAAFLTEARRRLNPLGCAVAADIFAITLESPSDEGIGQSPRVLSGAVDVLSPMIYTYTYGPGWKGFDDPNDHPIEIVSGALDAGIPRLEGFSIYRPWLQRAFLEDDEILDLVDVAEVRGMGWMLWSANTTYNAAMLPPP